MTDVEDKLDKILNAVERYRRTIRFKTLKLIRLDH